VSFLKAILWHDDVEDLLIVPLVALRDLLLLCLCNSSRATSTAQAKVDIRLHKMVKVKEMQVNQKQEAYEREGFG